MWTRFAILSPSAAAVFRVRISKARIGPKQIYSTLFCHHKIKTLLPRLQLLCNILLITEMARLIAVYHFTTTTDAKLRYSVAHWFDFQSSVCALFSEQIICECVVSKSSRGRVSINITYSSIKSNETLDQKLENSTSNFLNLYFLTGPPWRSSSATPANRTAPFYSPILIF